MAFTNIMRIISFALALCALSTQAAPARFSLRDLPSINATASANTTETSVNATTSANTTETSVNATSTTQAPVPTQSAVSHCNITEYKATHADPKNSITLWKGIRNDFDKVAKLKEKMEIKHDGDFRKAFYLTDTKESAAQLACHSGKQKRAVAVFEYEWQPGSASTYEFGYRNDEWKAFVLDRKEDRISKENDIVAGPVREQKDIATAVWQYAITNEKTLANLKLKNVHRPVRCRSVPKRKLC